MPKCNRHVLHLVALHLAAPLAAVLRAGAVPLVAVQRVIAVPLVAAPRVAVKLLAAALQAIVRDQLAHPLPDGCAVWVWSVAFLLDPPATSISER